MYHYWKVIFQRNAEMHFSELFSQNDNQSFHPIKFVVFSVTDAHLSVRILSFREVPFREIG